MAEVLVGLKPHGWLHRVVVGPKKEEGVKLGGLVSCLVTSEGGGGAHLFFNYYALKLWDGLEIQEANLRKGNWFHRHIKFLHIREPVIATDATLIAFVAS